MGGGQPDVQRHDAGLHAETGEEQEEDGALLSGRKLGRQQMEAGKIRGAGEGREQQEGGENHGGSRVRHDDVHEGGAAGLGLLVLKRHQAKARNRHDFPGGEEEERVGRGEDQGQAEQQDIVEKAERSQIAGALHGAQIVERVYRYRKPQKRQGERKPGGQRI